MFSKRGSIGSARVWNRGFISELASDLTDAGFKDITVKLPVDLEILVRDQTPMEKRIESEILNREVDLQYFLDNERNYPAIILIAQNKQKKETIKILFVNISKKTNFMDATFPSGHSEPSQLYIQSPDPSRVYGLYHFFMEYLRNNGDSIVGRAIWGLFSFVFLSAEFISIVSTRKGFLQNAWKLSGVFDVLVVLFLLYSLFRFFNTPTGLSVNKRETATLMSYLQRALKGEFKDNPLVNIIITVLTTVLSAIILRLIGWP